MWYVKGLFWASLSDVILLRIVEDPEHYGPKSNRSLLLHLVSFLHLGSSCCFIPGSYMKNLG